jgi:uncharacterized repeat protein (TIGR03803 family)
MCIRGERPVLRDHRSRRNLARQIPRRPLVVRNSRLLASAVIAIILAGGPIASATPSLTTLVTFDGNNGIAPQIGLTADAAGNLYGAAITGGANGQGGGTVFEIAAGVRTYTTLATFNFGNGYYPDGLTADSAGNLYGVTERGGLHDDGVVFEIAAGTHAISTLATFNGGNGSDPHGGLVADTVGNLYGTTYAGGANDLGTVFKVAAGTHAISTLMSFNGDNGAHPFGAMITDAAGNLYGSTINGGPSSAGTLFKIAAGTHAFSTLVTFNISNGSGPEGALLIDAAGNLYGTTLTGGANSFYGTVFEVTSGTSVLSTLATFDGNNGSTSDSVLIADAAGNLFGTTSKGGANDDGTVFEVAAGTHALSTLATFDRINGANPLAGMSADSAGNLFGTTSEGGANDDGTVFELTDSGFVTSAPEPTGVSLIALTGAGLLARRRRSCNA